MIRKQLNEDEIIRLYVKEKWSSNRIGKEFGVCYATILRRLRSHSIKIRKRSPSNFNIKHTFFDNINSEQKAYILGLLYADGNVYKRTVSLPLAVTDKDIVTKVNKILGGKLNFRERSKLNPKWQDVYTMRIYSQYMADSLKKVGCIPTKSLILQFPTEEQVPTGQMRHFLRGVVDGDGCILKNNGSFQYVKITSSKSFCYGLKEWYVTNFGYEPKVYPLEKDHPEKVHDIRWNAISGREFLNWIYTDATLYMERKYKQWEELLQHKHNKHKTSKKQVLMPYTNAIIALYKEGHSTYEIAIMYSVGSATVLRFLKANGITMRSNSEAQKLANSHRQLFLPFLRH